MSGWRLVLSEWTFWAPTWAPLTSMDSTPLKLLVYFLSLVLDSRYCNRKINEQNLYGEESKGSV